MSESVDRYARQVRLAAIGPEGQAKLRAAHVAIVGCGALGSACAEFLTRAGVGTLTIIDRDVVEWTNLQRQLLFDERDVRRSLPKAEAAKARLGHINSDVRVRAFYDDLSWRNAERYLCDADVIVDGLDNLETRYLLNDLAIKHALPYVYGAAVGYEGMSMVIAPHLSLGKAAGGDRPAGHRAPCLRCLFPEAPPAGTLGTCETVGVLGTLTATVAAFESTQAMKLLIGAHADIDPSLHVLDWWRTAWRSVDCSLARDPACTTCGERRFAYLDGTRMPRTAIHCGRQAVQIDPAAEAAPIDLDQLLRRLGDQHEVTRHEHWITVTLRGEVAPTGEGIELTVFEDGRIVVRGTREPEFARVIAAKYVGT